MKMLDQFTSLFKSTPKAPKDAIQRAREVDPSQSLGQGDIVQLRGGVPVGDPEFFKQGALVEAKFPRGLAVITRVSNPKGQVEFISEDLLARVPAASLDLLSGIALSFRSTIPQVGDKVTYANGIEPTPAMEKGQVKLTRIADRSPRSVGLSGVQVHGVDFRAELTGPGSKDTMDLLMLKKLDDVRPESDVVIPELPPVPFHISGPGW